jgi:hypothetical protein
MHELSTDHCAGAELETRGDPRAGGRPWKPASIAPTQDRPIDGWFSIGSRREIDQELQLTTAKCCNASRGLYLMMGA